MRGIVCSGILALILFSIEDHAQVIVTHASGTGQVNNKNNTDIWFGTNNTERMRINTAGKVGIAVSPTAYLHLPAGTAAAGTAPLKINAGTLNTTPEAGTIENDGDQLYFTNSAGIRGGIPIVRRIYKTANEVVNNSTALQDDDHLLFTATANTPYFVELILAVTATSTTPDFKFTFTLPSGTMDIAGGNFQANSSAWISAGASGSTEYVDLANAAGQSIFIRGVINVGATGGTVRFRWAQNSTSATAVTLLQNSMMIITPVQ